MKWFLGLVVLVIIGVWVGVAVNRLSSDAIAAITVSVVAFMVLGVIVFVGALIWSSQNHQTHRERVASIKAQHQARISAQQQWQPPVIVIEGNRRVRLAENPNGASNTEYNGSSRRLFSDYADHIARLTQDAS